MRLNNTQHMNKIIKIGITELNNQKIKSVNKIKVVEGKGISELLSDTIKTINLLILSLFDNQLLL